VTVIACIRSNNELDRKTTSLCDAFEVLAEDSQDARDASRILALQIESLQRAQKSNETEIRQLNAELAETQKMVNQLATGVNTLTEGLLKD